MMDEETKILEEWKTTRSTIVELDHILSNIRSLDVTATTILFGTGFQFTDVLFLVVIIINVAFWLLEVHYHKYLNQMSSNARNLETKLNFELTKSLHSTRNTYKGIDKMSLKYIKEYLTAHIYHLIYFGFIVLGVVFYLL